MNTFIFDYGILQNPIDFKYLSTKALNQVRGRLRENPFGSDSISSVTSVRFFAPCYDDSLEVKTFISDYTWFNNTMTAEEIGLPEHHIIGYENSGITDSVLRYFRLIHDALKGIENGNTPSILMCSRDWTHVQNYGTLDESMQKGFDLGEVKLVPNKRFLVGHKKICGFDNYISYMLADSQIPAVKMYGIENQ